MIIYKITNKINNKVYIGKTTDNIQYRFLTHKQNAKKKINCRLYDSMNHHGCENFKIEEIENVSSLEELNEREKYWIKFYNSMNKVVGYNMTSGGTGGDTYTSQSEQRRKEICKKRSKSMIGKNKDKKMSEEQKEKIRNTLTGRKLSKETKNKMSESQKITQNKPELKKVKRKLRLGMKYKTKKIGREMVIGDIHGAHKALTQVLGLAKFDYEKDTLISLGDVADGWTEVAECFEELLKIKNFILVRGNHDQWLKEWFFKGKQPDVWTMQGGQNTILSYEKHPELIEKHKKFLKSSKHYYLDKQNRVFVHGGIDPTLPMEKQDKMFLMWDRGLLGVDFLPEYKEVYVGHTTIYSISKKPLNQGNIWFMDTGAGWEGVLSLMDINTKEVWQSDVVATLYPGIAGRN